jgi:formylglycine-generating enzyme required for sulfatase activity
MIANRQVELDEVGDILSATELAQSEAALATLRQKEAGLLAELKGAGAIAQGGGEAVAATGEGSIAIGRVEGDITGSIIAGGEVNQSQLDQRHQQVGTQTNIKAETVVINPPPPDPPRLDPTIALDRYLGHVIEANRRLQLQGIRSAGELVSIELEQVYVTLRATRQREVRDEEAFLDDEARLAPGERYRRAGQLTTETVTVSVPNALAGSRRLVVLGDPGSGKTTLLRYLALTYARDVAEKGRNRVERELGLAESGHLPVLLELRRIGRFLAQHRPVDDGTDGHGLLLDFLHEAWQGEKIKLPADFFDDWLTGGRAVILLDGLDEVADPDLRRRVARLVEAFARAYPACRWVVTSRVVGYSGPARLGEAFTVTTVRDFSLAEVERFLSNWHRLLAVGQHGPGAVAERQAAAQTAPLLQAIRSNERIRELAINPLLLTVIAVVHRDLVQLPDRRAALYAEAVEVLLGQWDEARGVTEFSILPDQPFDAGDKRLVLQNLALHLHEQQSKEIGVGELRPWLATQFAEVVTQPRQVAGVVERFLRVIEERAGLLIAREEGVYAFSHLTFQEYLAALAAANRDDYVAYLLARSGDDWWREVILLAAGYLSSQSTAKTSRLIRAIAEYPAEPEAYHNLVLAADCLLAVGSGRVKGEVPGEVQRRLRRGVEKPAPLLTRWLKGVGAKSWIEQRGRAMAALGRAGAGYWTLPYGEPEWVKIPAGEFWLGGEGEYDGKPVHRLYLPTYQISKTPITNAQYQLFTQSTGHRTPGNWEYNRPPKGRESHPVVEVDWEEAVAYCGWLSEQTGKLIRLPSEAEWEKAARGDKDQRVYPWGDNFEATRCNSAGLGLRDTTPVGIFPEGASPYGCLDMVGNVGEWTRSEYEDYPYDPTDGREDLKRTGVPRVLRGGSFHEDEGFARCASRNLNLFDGWNSYLGFRVVCGAPLLTSDR